MTILILDNSPQAIAESLDDRSLDEMIKSIAQVLCNVHYIKKERIELGLDQGNKLEIPFPHIPHRKYKSYEPIAQLSEWARECVANYRWLVELGNECDKEYHYRWVHDEIPIEETDIFMISCSAIHWASVYIPELPNGSMTPFPLVMPEKYIKNDLIMHRLKEKKILLKTINAEESYRNYYNHLLVKGLNKKVKCKSCNGSGEGEEFVLPNGDWSLDYCDKCEEGYISKPIIPTWTLREKPEWINLEIKINE